MGPRQCRTEYCTATATILLLLYRVCPKAGRGLAGTMRCTEMGKVAKRPLKKAF
jgi:hypothetical protein